MTQIVLNNWTIWSCADIFTWSPNLWGVLSTNDLGDQNG